MTEAINLFSPVKLGRYTLPNRIMMAPMTRMRAIGSIPNSLMATYYAQRASAGLIITESAMISPLSNTYMNCPGIYSQPQVEGWKLVTDAVHARGGKIFLQIWHSGRVGHPSLLNGKLPVAPSAIAPNWKLDTPLGKLPIETPRALEIDEIAEIIQEFRSAAKNAMIAGFDGVEIHGGFGFLIDQFLQDGANHRTDKYGGSLANRTRFLLEVVEAVTGVWGSDRVGIKLAPSNTVYGIFDADRRATFSYAIDALNSFNLAYLHLPEPKEVDIANGNVINPVAPTFRPIYKSAIVTNCLYDKAKANAVLAAGDADLVSFARLFIANPDLPERFAINAPLNTPNPKTFCPEGENEIEKGYTDYSYLESNRISSSP
ncbi:alkene reductase [Aerosakkonema funiforme]|uniref:alkene reductase n=1 Tax=Aerosakkonema funiforme TaxID=1246630 RepID=UPI0035B92CD1